MNFRSGISTLFATTAIILAGLGGAYVIVINWANFKSGEYRWSEKVLSRCPLQRHEVMMRTRTRFPAFDMADPALELELSLRSVGTLKTVASSRILLKEDSDLNPPVVKWTTNNVVVEGYNSRKPGAQVTLDHPSCKVMQ